MSSNKNRKPRRAVTTTYPSLTTIIPITTNAAFRAAIRNLYRAGLAQGIQDHVIFVTRINDGELELNVAAADPENPAAPGEFQVHSSDWNVYMTMPKEVA